MRPDSFRHYVTVYAMVVALVALPFGVQYVFLVRAYEVSRYSEIISEQFRRRGTYDSALNGNDLKYKVELIRRVGPEVVVVGSSRAMNVRDLAFTRPFVNAGGVSSNLLEAETFVREMLAVHQPKVVIYFLDYWWFNSRQEQTSNRFRIDETAISFTKLTSPFVWLYEGRIAWALYRDVVLHGHHENANTTLDNLGIFAMRDSSGFRTDGSYFNARIVMGEKGPLEGYREELAQIAKGQNERVNLGLGDFVNEDNVKWFLRTLEGFKEKDIAVILVLPPVAPLHLKTIRASAKAPFVAALATRLEKDVGAVYDFSDFGGAGASDCEYIDGYHIGDTLSLRVLDAIVERTPGSPLAGYIDRRKLASYLARFSGRALIPEDPAQYKKPEFDFLDLGCNKPPVDARAWRPARRS
jgi:hypothetical protein